MDIIDIRLISSSEYDQLISIDRSSMPPPGRWRELARRNLGTDNWFGFILQPRFHLKDVQVIEVNIFWVATTKSHNLSPDWVCCVKTFVTEMLEASDIWLDPRHGIEVKSPEIIQVARGDRLTSHDYHVPVHQGWGMVGPRVWSWAHFHRAKGYLPRTLFFNRFFHQRIYHL